MKFSRVAWTVLSIVSSAVSARADECQRLEDMLFAAKGGFVTLRGQSLSNNAWLAPKLDGYRLCIVTAEATSSEIECHSESADLQTVWSRTKSLEATIWACLEREGWHAVRKNSNAAFQYESDDGSWVSVTVNELPDRRSFYSLRLGR